MVTIALELYDFEKESGRYLHLDIEPEPDGLLENTTEVIDYFQNYLLPEAYKRFKTIDIPKDKADKLLKKYITVCYDVCHFSLAYEKPHQTFERLNEYGIKVGKMQISSALKILNANDNQAIWDALEGFNEPTYLHQVTEKVNNTVVTYSDLPVILKTKNHFSELRAHFHVPIFLKDFGVLQSTQDQILATLAYLKENPEVTNHLEIETYTWQVLPDALKIPIGGFHS